MVEIVYNVWALQIGRLRFASLFSHYVLIFMSSKHVAACLQVGRFPVDPAARGFSSATFGVSAEVP